MQMSKILPGARAIQGAFILAAAAMLSALGWSAACAANLYIHQHNLRFSEKEVSLRAGDLLIFTNDDDVIHNIGIRGADDTQDLGLQRPGATVSRRFNSAGSFLIVCSVHPRMRVKIDVSQ